MSAVCRKQFKSCKLRVFSLANRADQLDRETRQVRNALMATLLQPGASNSRLFSNSVFHIVPSSSVHSTVA